jgi:hypothetical protein
MVEGTKLRGVGQRRHQVRRGESLTQGQHQARVMRGRARLRRLQALQEARG